MFGTRHDRRQGPGGRPPGEDLPHARRRRGRDTRFYRNRITGKIADSSFIGVSTQYVIDSAVCPEFEVYAQNIDRDSRLVPGADVVLHWSPAHTFGLDAAQSPLAGTEVSAGVDTAEEEAA